MKYLLMIFGVMILFSCEKPPMEPEIEYCECEDFNSPIKSNIINIGNGYNISFPKDTIICNWIINQIPVFFDCFEEYYGLNMSFGYCNLNYYTDPPCVGDVQYFNHRDSITLPVPKVTSLIHIYSSEPFNYTNGYYLCKEGEVFGCIVNYIDEDSTHQVGSIYLKTTKRDVLYNTGIYSSKLEYLSLMDSIMHSIQPE